MSRQKTPYAALRPRNIGINEAMWREIIYAWENGLSDREAAFRAARDASVLVSEAQIKKMLREFPQVASLKEFLVSNITSRAKLNIAQNIEEGNISTSKWYLERKAADEFSTKQAVAFDGAVVELSMDDKRKQMDEFMSQFDTDKEVVTDEEVSDGESGT